MARPGPRAAARATGSLAAAVLAPGGRLVAFVPARGDEIELSLAELLERRVPDARERGRLRVVDARLQRFKVVQHSQSTVCWSTAIQPRTRGPVSSSREVAIDWRDDTIFMHRRSVGVWVSHDRFVFA